MKSDKPFWTSALATFGEIGLHADNDSGTRTKDLKHLDTFCPSPDRNQSLNHGLLLVLDRTTQNVQDLECQSGRFLHVPSYVRVS